MSPVATRDIEEGIRTGIPEVPVTEELRPFAQDEDHIRLTQAGVARVNIAPSYEEPNGTLKDNYAARHRSMTVLQQHCEFWDPDHDGIVWPMDTYRGFMALGYGVILSIVSVLVIHLNFSYPTLPPGHFLPDPFFRLHLARIHKDKHGSDSGTYDHEGRYVPQKFEDIFSKYAAEKDSITIYELMNYFNHQRVLLDFFGWGGAIFEWTATWILLWPEDGKMKKDDIRRIYDGSIFYELAARRQKLKQ